jgi:hypothetical protein
VAKRALVADPTKAHQDMLRLVSRMSIPENIPPGKAAFNITVKPREADIIQPYKKGSYTGGPKPDILKYCTYPTTQIRNISRQFSLRACGIGSRQL